MLFHTVGCCLRYPLLPQGRTFGGVRVCAVHDGGTWSQWGQSLATAGVFISTKTPRKPPRLPSDREPCRTPLDPSTENTSAKLGLEAVMHSGRLLVRTVKYLMISLQLEGSNHSDSHTFDVPTLRCLARPFGCLTLVICGGLYASFDILEYLEFIDLRAVGAVLVRGLAIV